MNWQHLKSILWLRWRLNVNQWSRAGKLNMVLTVGLVVGAIGFSVIGFFATLIAGYFLLPDADPEHLMLVFDVAIVGFLFFWMIGLMVELQRTDALSLDKLLHLPISPSGTFLLNYLTSLFSLALIVFLPAMTGLAIATVIVKGPAMLMSFPLLFGFVLMVTAVTYQFRGWLALLMLDKRRRRTVIVVLTMGFVLLFQVPYLVNATIRRPGRDDAGVKFDEDVRRIDRALENKEITADQHNRQISELSDTYFADKKQSQGRIYRQIVDGTKWANLVFPPGWLAYGVAAGAEGRLLPGLWGTLGLLAIAAVSLRRSYRTTLRIFTGDYQSARARRQSAKRVQSAATPAETASSNFLEKRLRWIPEQAAVIALANFRSLTRAPEAKMILLTPIIMLCVFGSTIFLGNSHEIPVFARPLIAVGAIVMPIMGLIPIMQNLFGFDRDGFRVFVLTPASGRDVLIGKNLSIATLAFAMCGLSLAAVQIMLPLQFSHFLATLVQAVIVYFVLCILGNQVSILAPVAMKAGTFAPAKPTLRTVLIQFVCMFLFPVALVPTAIPLGLDLWLDYLGWRSFVPIYLILSVLECIIGVWIYKRIVSAQGRLLVRREQRILSAVTANIT